MLRLVNEQLVGALLEEMVFNSFKFWRFKAQQTEQKFQLPAWETNVKPLNCYIAKTTFFENEW